MENQNQQQQQETVFTMKEMGLLLNCRIETLCEIQYKYGIAYLHWYLPCDERARRKLESSRLFWNWYKFQWEQRDFALINDVCFQDESIKQRRRFYQEFHNAQAMCEEVKPNTVVLNELNKKEPVYE